MEAQRLAAFAVMAALAGAATAGPALAAAPTTTQNVDRAMTKLAASVVSDASDARAALSEGKTAAATTDIDDALTARDSLASKASAAGMPMIVPVYAELDDTAVLTNAVKQAKTTGNAPKTVRANDADLTYVAIDLDKAKSHLDAAKKAIADRNTVAARDSLAAVGSDLVEVSVVTDVPLLTAREDLARAQREMNANDRAAATADLRQAAKSLKTYTQGQYVADARQLASQIDTNAAMPGTSNATASEKIADWWSSVKAWFAQHT